ncbi:MAG: PEP-CTERM sorting domain-containing protein, partial [Caldilineaceae bacterium]|nr:PEP-CTERM sorting domain-containing protein [Caldilineaceae bacterium]
IDIIKYTNGEDANTPTGPEIQVGNPVAWTYLVTNNGNVALSEVAVTDDRGVAVTCPKTTLAVGENMTCTANGTATEGQYANIGTVTGRSPTGQQVTDNDPSHYIGRSTPTRSTRPVQIPEPVTVVLFGTGLAALSAAVAARKRKE